MTQSAATTDGYVVVERRRSQRSAVSYQAVGVMPQDRSFPCDVVNISDGGAMLRIDDVDVLPDRMRLVIPDLDATHDCDVVWKRACDVGVRFR